MKPSVLIRFTVPLVVLMFASPGLAGDWQEFAVSPSLDDQEEPDVDGNKIVWQQLTEHDHAENRRDHRLGHCHRRQRRGQRPGSE